MSEKTADTGMGSWQPGQQAGNFGIGNAAPQVQPRFNKDPWPDGSNDGFKPIDPETIEDAGELMSSDPIIGLESIDSATFKPKVMPRYPGQRRALYDPVRDVTPATKSAPAPAAQGVVGDPWTDLGDNGIVTNLDLSDPMIKKFLEHMQITFPAAGFFPGATDINKVGADVEELPSLREPNDLDKHIVVNHQLPQNTTVYPVDLVKQLHLSLHAEGQSSDHNPEVLRVANILDPIQESLDAKIWDNPEADEPKIKPSLNSWIRQAIFGTLKNAGYKEPEDWIKLILTGSLTTYQWSEESDLDVSIWVDLNLLPDFKRSEMIKVIIENLDGDLVPGTNHPIQCFVVDVNEVTSPDQIYKEGVRSAYDLDGDTWIIKPERNRSQHVPTKFPDFFRKAKQASAKMQLLLKFQPEAAKTYWHFLHKRRREDMKMGFGDYSESNIVYKMLANDGLFDQISEITGEHIAKLESL